MKKLLILFVLLLSAVTVTAQGSVIYVPIIVKSGDNVAIDPRLVITDGTIEVDLLGIDSGWELADPYWNPKIAQYKGGGTHVNAQLAEGQRLVHREYDNVIETIPLSLRGTNQAQAMKTANEALGLLRQAGDYWTEPYEYDQVWIEVKFPCNACLTGYSRIIKGTIPELTNPFGQPSFSSFSESVMEGITVTLEREPFWQITKPGEIIGPLFNLIDNPDFELWNFGVVDSQPDSWDNVETTHIAGQNGQDQTLPKFGQSAVKIRVSGSTLAGAAKGITQVINDTENNTEYTIVAWVRSEGVSNGVGRILVNYADQLELYRDSASHGWTLYTGTITTGSKDTVSINIEILTTAANTDGTIYVDGLMFIEGDWEQEAADNVLPYISGSHIVNHWDNEAADINWVDAWNVPGSVNSTIRLDITNNNDVSADTEPNLINGIRVGMRRSRNIFNFFNYFDPEGTTTDSDTSRGKNISISGINTDFLTAFVQNISDNTQIANSLGRHRAFARVKNNSATNDLLFRIGYTTGLTYKYLDTVIPDVKQSWTMVDLTNNRAVNLDTKPTEPSLINYKLDVQGVTTGQSAEVDYVILMPTDGGYFETNEGGVLPGYSLILDGTIESGGIQVGLGKANNLWSVIYNTPSTPVLNYYQHRITQFRGDIYAIVDDNTMLKVSGTTVSTVSTPGGQTYISGFAELDGFLYIIGHVFGTDTINLFRSADGITWGSVASIVLTRAYAFTGFTISEPIVYQGNLFFSASASGGARDFHILQWDGSTLTTAYYVDDGTSKFMAMSFDVQGGDLYTSRDTNLLRRNADGSWTAASTGIISVAQLYWMRTYQEKLYIVNTLVSPTNQIQFWDGSTITNVTLPSDLQTQTVYNIGIYNDDFWIGDFQNGNPFFGAIYTGDFVTFCIAKYPPLSAANNLALTTFIEHNSTLFGILYDTLTADLNLVSYSSNTRCGRLPEQTQSIIYSTTISYSGGQFLAPPRTRVDTKRHRYFFNYDRSNFVNAVDDKALIGIGFVPRYLEPPMKEN